MTDVINFIKANWVELAKALVLLIILVATLIKRKGKVIDTIKGYVLEILPELINKAEDKYGAGTGPTKLDYVVQTLEAVLSREFGLSQTQLYLYRGFFKKSVKAIMSTPKEKKER